MRVLVLNITKFRGYVVLKIHTRFTQWAELVSFVCVCWWGGHVGYDVATRGHTTCVHCNTD